MVAKAALIGLGILVIGLIVGVYGAYAPNSTQKATTVTLLNTQTSIDANGYSSKNTVLSKGQTVNITASIANSTIFGFYVMNQTQYYAFYGCAPLCHTAANVSGVGPVPPQNLTTLLNVTSITPSSPFSRSFTAPSNGTYYYILDNSVGPSWATYIGQNASVVACHTGIPSACSTLVTLQLTTPGTQTVYSVNWAGVGSGAALLIIGGAVATVMWEARVSSKPPAT